MLLSPGTNSLMFTPLNKVRERFCCFHLSWLGCKCWWSSVLFTIPPLRRNQSPQRGYSCCPWQSFIWQENIFKILRQSYCFLFITSHFGNLLCLGFSCLVSTDWKLKESQASEVKTLSLLEVSRQVLMSDQFLGTFLHVLLKFFQAGEGCMCWCTVMWAGTVVMLWWQ